MNMYVSSFSLSSFLYFQKRGTSERHIFSCVRFYFGSQRLMNQDWQQEVGWVAHECSGLIEKIWCLSHCRIDESPCHDNDDHHRHRHHCHHKALIRLISPPTPPLFLF